MKKLVSLIKASMTSDMNLFKIKTKNKNKKSGVLVPLFIGAYLMFMIWSVANGMYEKLEPTHVQYVLLSLFVFAISLMTIAEGIYKAGPLIFNCKDDQLLLSLPIKRRTVIFVRVFKFYVFELLFNSMFLFPTMVAYIRWAEHLDWTYYLVSVIMLLFLPIIPIVISCIIGAITSSVSSRFKYKNFVQIVVSMIFILGIIYVSYNIDGLFNYLAKNATSLNDLITKIYYPAGVYAKLATEFNVLDLLIFILVNIVIFVIGILILSKVYFKINSRLKKVTTSNKKVKIDNLTIKKRSVTTSLVRKEISTFFKTPVFIINAGFGLVLFIIAAIAIALKFDSVLPMLTDPNGMAMEEELIMNNLSVLVLALVSATAYMTSITNSVVSLEGRNINILKALPVKTETILMSKIYSSLVITTPVLLIGDIILFFRFNISIIESLLLIILSILIPLVSHFIGIIVNLKYPKLDFENSTEVVKQSTSSFLSVMIGMVLLMVSIALITGIAGKISSLLILIIFTVIYLIIDFLLYLYMSKKGVKEFNALTV